MESIWKQANFGCSTRLLENRGEFQLRFSTLLFSLSHGRVYAHSRGIIL